MKGGSIKLTKETKVTPLLITTPTQEEQKVLGQKIYESSNTNMGGTNINTNTK